MLVDIEKNPSVTDVEGDVCIIGAGAVGLTMAVKLANLGLKVIVAEAGGVSLESRSQQLLQGKSSGHPFKHIQLGRYRVLGGTTTFWGGQVVPFDETVFEKRPWVADVKWPFSRETLDPYYAEAYNMLLLGNAEFDDAAVWQRVGNRPENLEAGLEIVLTRWTPKRNFAKLYGREIDQNPNLNVLVHANVVGFSLDETRNRVETVHARSLKGHEVHIRAKHVVAASGTIEISRLLKLPTRDGGSAPWQNNVWLGRGFMDHLDSIAGTVKILDHKRFHNLFDNIYQNGFKYYPKLKLSTKAQQEEQLVDIAAQFLYDTKYSEHLDNIKMFARSLLDGRAPSNWLAMPAHIYAVSKIAAPLAIRYLLTHRSFKPSNASVRLALYSEQMPTAESEIRLSDELDALGLPKVDIHWAIDGRELHSFAEFAKRIKAYLKKENLAEVTLDQALLDEDSAFLKKTGDAIHAMSGARIGTNPHDGVVDANLKVFNTSNLHVAGAAVFPTTGFANPTLTGIALGLRLAEHLKREISNA